MMRNRSATGSSATSPSSSTCRGSSRDTARRLLDFASGLCYARDGEMRKVANAVYMLVPANVVVTDDDRRRVTEQGIGT